MFWWRWQIVRSAVCGVAVAALLFGSATFAATYYISPTGHDTLGNGSEFNPYREIRTAIKLAYAGDVIYVADGDGSPNLGEYIAGCTNLVSLSLINNNLSKLNLSGCSKLRYLYCSNNVLTNLNLSGCSSLEYLRCERNVGLRALNLSWSTNLVSLRCIGNTMTGTLDVSMCSGLSELLAHKKPSLQYIKVADITNPPAVLQYEYTTTIIGP